MPDFTPEQQAAIETEQRARTMVHALSTIIALRSGTWRMIAAATSASAGTERSGKHDE